MFPSQLHSTHVTPGFETSSVLQPDLCFVNIKKKVIASERSASYLYSDAECPAGWDYFHKGCFTTSSSSSSINNTDEMSEVCCRNCEFLQIQSHQNCV